MTPNKRNSILNSDVAIVLTLGLIVLIGIVVLSWVRHRGPWYLGCAHRNGAELLLKTDRKPRIEGSLIFLEDDMFVTPEAGMTCRIVRVNTIEGNSNE